MDSIVTYLLFAVISVYFGIRLLSSSRRKQKELDFEKDFVKSTKAHRELSKVTKTQPARRKESSRRKESTYNSTNNSQDDSLLLTAAVIYSTSDFGGGDSGGGGDCGGGDSGGGCD